MTEQDHMSLGAFLYPTGYHVAAWRHPDVPSDAGVNIRHYVELAHTAERGLFDFLFLPDSAAMRGQDLGALSRTAIRYVAQFEPLTLLGALAAVTDNIGLTATVSSSYNEPYHAARKIASLDHISSGRAGWNLVTSQNPEEALNFGWESQPDHAARYERAREFAEVVTGLWQSWDEGGFVLDKEQGRFFDPDKLHVLDHRGAHFSVRGPLNIPRPPQGLPVTIQSGSSEAGRDLAARHADIVFTAQFDFEGAHAFRADIRDRAKRQGRDPDSIKVLVGVMPFVGHDAAEAHAKMDRLQQLIQPEVALSLLGSELGGVDLKDCDPNGPLPELPASNAGKSRQALLVRMAQAENLSVLELARKVAGSRGHWQPINGAQACAEELEHWFREGAADGFIVIPAQLPGSLEDFVETVVPHLQRRGVFRRSYTGRTLREHIGLPVSTAPGSTVAP